MTVNPFPEIASSDDLSAVPTAAYVECANCVNLTRITDGVDPAEWARDHTSLRPWHTRFRILHITNFSVPVDWGQPSHATREQPTEASHTP
ncbi:hypothetical protein [Streptomyces sp. NPDC086782]|uniref:hypothetical protein n=1 Tax=Streptomyces sp. NPDC086782 TaxID=3365757 RepID=UPI0037FDD30F